MIEELVEGVRRRARRQPAARAVRSATGSVAARVYDSLYEETPIWDRDWDVLCVLDACRVDLMRELAATGEYGFLPGPEGVDTLWSVGSQSAEWMDRTFDAAYADDLARTAYVTGNPFTGQTCEHVDVVGDDVLPLREEAFGLLYEAWRTEWMHASISTIPPEPLTDATIDVWRRREELGVDQVVVHYMQPHAPFRSKPDWFYGNADLEGWGQISGEEGGVGEGLWQKVRSGTHDREEFWDAYRDNLEWVLGDLRRLVDNCDADIVFTSDHGNGHGEWGVWSHPPGVTLPALRRVPWVRVEGRDLGTCEPERTAFEEERAVAAAGETDVEERLADLGYR